MRADWHVNRNSLLGYLWTVQAQYGTIEIAEEELFSRIEFSHLTKHEYKVSYAMDQGWRYNVDSGKWYRIKGY